ncbi:thioredoxin domain-containing protein, partial [bacterium]|nr:thioredoxin domain-containing protein [bacterium]
MRSHNSNKLSAESSPYLLQHADNPVDWYPWGDEAFARAKIEDKPIFLSIGYSTCHWCHVMAHESFENQEVADLMNETFINIKVDREERPDIDNIYMTVCQLLTGSGGWPLTLIMTPDREPFYAATYIPRTARFGRLGMVELIPRINELWRNERSDLMKSANQIIDALRQVNSGTGESEALELDQKLLDRAYGQLHGTYDAALGGFGGAPKFPTPHNLLFLLRYWHRTQNVHALQMVENTLRQMRRGGVYDHIGFGFHRYATDAHWLLPHFEKMLYDQAMLTLAYTELYQITGKKRYRDIVEEILTYIRRDMTSPEGGFYSAEDADSDGKEGKFYVWTEGKIRELLSPDDAETFIRVYNVKPKGNFREESSGAQTGENILHLEKSLSDHAAKLSMSEKELSARLESARQILFKHREQRIHPSKDDKILTDWNGLMIA